MYVNSVLNFFIFGFLRNFLLLNCLGCCWKGLDEGVRVGCVYEFCIGILYFYVGREMVLKG